MAALEVAAPDAGLMRILGIGNMYPPHHQGGYELIWLSADEYLRRKGHEVRSLTTDYVEPGTTAADPGDVHRDLRWYWRDHAWPRFGARGSIATERHNGAVLARHLREFAPDAIAWWAMGGMSLCLLERARRAGVPSVAVVCDEWLVYGPTVDPWTRAFVRRPWLRPIAERLLRLPARIELAASAEYLFLSRVLRDDAAKVDPALGRGEIAHRGPDAEHFHAAPPQEWRWRLAYVGRIDPRKGIDSAIEALADLPAEATLRIVGSGDERHSEELRALAADAGVADRVSFSVADRAELGAVYAEADVIIFPVRWKEPWGLVPLEAMAVGTPVVATGLGGSGEYLEDGRNCLLFPAEAGSAAIAERVRRLAADADLRRRLREGGLATAAGLSADGFNARVERALSDVAR